MDNNIENTDRFFREPLLVYEEIPGDQVWDKIASRLEVARRRKLIFLVLRIAAGMTLLVSLGLGYHFINQSVNQKSVAVVSKTSVPEKAVTSPFKSGMQKNKALLPNTEPVHPVNSSDETPVYEVNNNPHPADVSTGIARLNMREASPLPVPLPHRLGYHRLSAEEILEQTAAITAGISADDKPSEENEDSRWMLGSEVAPLYSYRIIESDYLDKSAVQKLNDSEQGLIALAGGLRVGFNAGRRLSVQSGLYYSRYGQQKNNGDAIAMDQIANVDKADITYLSIPNSTGTIRPNEMVTLSANTVSTSDPKLSSHDFVGYSVPNTGTTQITEGDITAVQYFDYLELPLTVKYKIIDRKLGFSFLGGLITNFLVNNGVQLKQNGNSESFGTTKDINKVNYQGSVGLGFDYPLMDRMSISLEPRFRYYLNPIDQRLNVHPYSFGLFAGISYRLK